MAGQLKECNRTELILMHSKVQLAFSCHPASIIEYCKLGELVKGKFEWRKENTEAFDELKNMISSDKVQACFDPEARHERHVNRSPMGPAATLTRKRPGEQEEQVVQYASRSLDRDAVKLQ